MRSEAGAAPYDGDRKAALLMTGEPLGLPPRLGFSKLVCPSNITMCDGV